jgi:type II secretory pathway pseudopilin PulG
VRGGTRGAFTLVELLVVIAIIIVLASLLLAAVFKVLDTANEAATRTDITQLASSVQAFQTKFQVPYIPSRLVLCKQQAGYFQAPGVYKSKLHQDSLEYLGRVWPKLDWTTLQPQGGPYTWQGIDWDPVNSPSRGQPVFLLNGAPVAEADLEGEQTLVFFLGGLTQMNSDQTFTPLGFSTNGSNPGFLGGDRIAPFFEFKSNRLQQWQGTAPGFPSYLDGYGKTPYAYFSSYKVANGYNPYWGIANPYLPAPAPVQLYNSDCQALRLVPGQPQGVWPYAGSWTPTVQYLNSQSFQIISAGKNLQFGLGTYPPSDPNYAMFSGTWSASQATVYYPTGDNNPSDPGAFGYDDIANFYDRLLGVPTQ